MRLVYILYSSCDDDDTITSIDDIIDTQSDSLSISDTSVRGGLAIRKSSRVTNNKKKYNTVSEQHGTAVSLESCSRKLSRF